jgi:acyl-CoA thioesterase II
MSDTQTQTPESLVARITRLLTVTPLGDDHFQGSRMPGGVGRVFGGQVIGQALMAATAAVEPDRMAHSLHAYFMRGGSEDHEITYRVERDFDGGSFSTRRVIALQQDRPILSMTASFQKLEQGFEHQDVMPDVPPPEDLPNEFEQRSRMAHLIPEAKREEFLRPRAIEFCAVESRHWMSSEPRPPITHSWFRTVAPMPDDPVMHRAMLAYMSDMTLLGTCSLPHGVSWMKGEIMGASLDHALWLHGDFRCDDWLLYVTESPWAGRGRGFNRGKIFTRDGRLVASATQEGLIRKLVSKP